MEPCREEFVSHMAQRQNVAVMRGALSKLRRVVFASRMALGRNDVALWGVPIKSTREEYVGHTAQR
jgi:hypothetical protein